MTAGAVVPLLRLSRLDSLCKRTLLLRLARVLSCTEGTCWGIERARGRPCCRPGLRNPRFLLPFPRPFHDLLVARLCLGHAISSDSISVVSEVSARRRRITEATWSVTMERTFTSATKRTLAETPLYVEPRWRAKRCDSGMFKRSGAMRKCQAFESVGFADPIQFRPLDHTVGLLHCIKPHPHTAQSPSAHSTQTLASSRSDGHQARLRRGAYARHSRISQPRPITSPPLTYLAPFARRSPARLPRPDSALNDSNYA